MQHIGMIGVGHLGHAVLTGLLKSQYINPQQLFISGGTSGKAQKIAAQVGCHYCTNNAEVLKQADIVILAVIPRILPNILNEIQPHLTANTIIVSAASSFTIEQFYQYLPQQTPIIRAIPNIPSEVCQGMTAMSASPQVTKEQLANVQQLFMAIGKIALVEEQKLDISSTVAGCSPAYVAVFVEALADAGVLAGLSREEAYLLSQQAVMGAAAVMLEQGMLPAELKDRVCSPGGTTIRGVAELEKFGLRNAVIEAVKASAKIKE